MIFSVYRTKIQGMPETRLFFQKQAGLPQHLNIKSLLADCRCCRFFPVQNRTHLRGCGNTMNFEWNRQKSQISLKKHGISFEEAKTVFDDPLYVDFYDPDHSDDEHRYLIVGRSDKGNRLLIVSYTERDDMLRLISARKTTRKERKAYENG